MLAGCFNSSLNLYSREPCIYGGLCVHLRMGGGVGHHRRNSYTHSCRFWGVYGSKYSIQRFHWLHRTVLQQRVGRNCAVVLLYASSLCGTVSRHGGTATDVWESAVTLAHSESVMRAAFPMQTLNDTSPSPRPASYSAPVV